MKKQTGNTSSERNVALSCVLALALAAPATVLLAQFEEPAGEPLPAAEEARNEVVGSVGAKDDSSLTVNDQSIGITDSTTYAKNGGSATLDDVAIGDEVIVTVSRTLLGRLKAEHVEIVDTEVDTDR